MLTSISSFKKFLEQINVIAIKCKTSLLKKEAFRLAFIYLYYRFEASYIKLVLQIRNTSIPIVYVALFLYIWIFPEVIYSNDHRNL